jgi:hypothetical protein
MKVPWRAGGGGLVGSEHRSTRASQRRRRGELRRVPLCAPGEDGPEL